MYKIQKQYGIEDAISAGGSLLQTGAQVGASIFDNIFNAKQTQVNNKNQMDFANQMYDKQRKDALTDVATQNLYNSPASQMQRLKEAGLNPNLVYGNGAAQSTSASPRAASVPSYNPTAVHIDTSRAASAIGNSISSFTDLQFKQAQTDNLKAATNVSTQDAILKAAQTASTIASTARTDVGTDTDTFNLGMAKQLASTSLEQASANLEKTKADINYTNANNQRQDALTENTLANGIFDRIVASKGLQLTEQQIINLKTDNRLKQLDENLKKMGIQPSDSMLSRMAAQVVDNIRNGGTVGSAIQKFYDRFTKDAGTPEQISKLPAVKYQPTWQRKLGGIKSNP